MYYKDKEILNIKKNLKSFKNYKIFLRLVTSVIQSRSKNKLKFI